VGVKKQLLSFVLVSIVLLNLGCKKTPTEPIETLALIVEDVSCTEAWLKLSVTNVQLPVYVSLLRNEKEVMNFTLTTNDTTVYTNSLLPKQTYTYQAILQPTNHQQLTTNKVAAVTMDTTSHNFTWQTFTFGGDAGSSALSDVAIINESNIWAVGTIYMKDSLGKPDPNAYNAVHWDGSKWEAKKISVLFRGSYVTPPLEGICAFSSSDIWFVGSLPIHGDGNNWTMYDLRTILNPNLSLSKAWGTNSSNIYFVGRTGSIAHYDGKNWQKIESGTTTSLDDLWGTDDGKTIWACGTSLDNHHSVLLKYENGQSTIIWQRDGLASVSPYGRSVGSIWLDNQMLYVTSSNGVFRIRGKEIIMMPDNIYEYSKIIRGNAGNDMLTIGSGDDTYHYNGVNWKLVKKGNATDFLLGGGIKGNLAVVVGTDFSVSLGAAMISVGRR
jgi:uncharacterized membrane protein